VYKVDKVYKEYYYLPMKKVTCIPIKEARANFSEIIDRASLTGEIFIVTKFGKPKVQISTPKNKPINQQSQATKHTEAIDAIFGMWKDRKDMTNSARWVADRRKQESLRTYNKK